MPPNAGRDPRGTVPLTPEDRDRVRLLTQAELLSEPNNGLPHATEGGMMRTHFRGLMSTNVRTSLIVVPVGQCSPVHTSRIEHIVFVLEGAVEFIVDGRRHRLERMDQLYFPPGLAYEYRNVALQTSCFYNVISPTETWPDGPTATYEPLAHEQIGL
jgi:quercetin dioxygenase-like cupin family protein